MNDSQVSSINFDEYNNHIYSILINFNGFLSLTVGIFGIYVTIFWTPKIFGSYKYFLLNIAVWSFLLDFYISVLYSPFFLYPAIVNCPTRILRTEDRLLAKIWFDIMLFLYGSVSIAVFCAFIYRFAHLNGKLKSVMSCGFLSFLGFLHLINEIPVIILHHLASYNYTAVEDAIVKRYPKIIKFFPRKDMACFTISFDVGTPYNYLYFLCFITCCSVPIPFIFYMIARMKNLLKQQRAIISHKTYMMHKELLKTLIFQLITPLFTLTIPGVAFGVLIIFRISSMPYLFQAIWISVACHSTMNTIMMVYFIKPYRKNFVYIFWHTPQNFLIEVCDRFHMHPYKGRNYLSNRSVMNTVSTIQTSIIPDLSVRPAESLFA